jgi:hypothetical protein
MFHPYSKHLSEWQIFAESGKMWRWEINKNRRWHFLLSHTSSIIHHEWNAYLMTVKRSGAPVTHQTLSCWWIKNGIKWASLLTLARSLARSVWTFNVLSVAPLFDFSFTRSLTLAQHTARCSPRKKMLYFYSNSFFRTHIFLLIERLWSSLIFGSV